MKTNSDILLRALVLIKCSILARAETPPSSALPPQAQSSTLHKFYLRELRSHMRRGGKNGVKPVCSSTCWGCWRSFFVVVVAPLSIALSPLIQFLPLTITPSLCSPPPPPPLHSHMTASRDAWMSAHKSPSSITFITRVWFVRCPCVGMVITRGSGARTGRTVTCFLQMEPVEAALLSTE